MVDSHRARLAANRLVEGQSRFTAQDLYEAALAVMAAGDPPRDRLVLTEARGRAAHQTERALNAWAAVAGTLELPETTFDMWIRPVTVVGEKDGVLVLRAPRSVATWLERRYLPRLRETALELTGLTDIEIREESIYG